jgi:hypothetical protein
MDIRQTQADILSLLKDSPITGASVKKDVTELVYVGEIDWHSVCCVLGCMKMNSRYLAHTMSGYALSR